MIVINSLHLHNNFAMRIIFRTEEFDEFYNDSDKKLKDKIEYVSAIIETIPVINTKVAKKLTNEILYETRIQINNEYRILTFTIDHENINQAKAIIFLWGFLKKDTKDYKKQIQKALKILEKWQENQNQ